MPEEPVKQQAQSTVPPSATSPVDAKEVEEGKVFAILSYVIPFFVLVPLIQRNNAFSLYHAKQCLIIWLIAIAASIVGVIPCLGWIVCLVVWVALLVFSVMGLINAVKGLAKPLPLIGKWGEEWFKGLKKV
jgi:uncharacterized membrane protein